MITLISSLPIKFFSNNSKYISFHLKDKAHKAFENLTALVTRVTKANKETRLSYTYPLIC